MTQPVVSSGFFHDLFAPLPESREERVRDPFDHIGDYVDTASGAWDVMRFGNLIWSVIEQSASPSHPLGGYAGKAKEIFNTAGIGLSIPQILSDLNNLRRSISDFFIVQGLPYNDPLRTAKITQAAKKSFLDSVYLTNTVSQIALFLDNAKLLAFEASHLNILDGVYNITSMIGDGAELAGEYFKLKHYHSPEAQPRNPTEAAKLEERKTLSWITIAKDVSSIASSVIGMGLIVFGVATASLPVVSVGLLTLSAFWLATKLTAYFYKKVIVEAPPVPFGGRALYA